MEPSNLEIYKWWRRSEDTSFLMHIFFRFLYQSICQQDVRNYSILPVNWTLGNAFSPAIIFNFGQSLVIIVKKGYRDSCLVHI